MLYKSIKERFKSSKEELEKLGREFGSEALPLLSDLNKTTHWILLNKSAANKVIKQVFFEAIEDCNITKNYSDWQSWIRRIWMREIVDFYSKKENEMNTVFDFIDHTEVTSNEVKAFFESGLPDKVIMKNLYKLPAVLRIPLMMREIYSLNYEKIAELIDVPDGVIATRIFRARKLFYILFRSDFNFKDMKKKASTTSYEKIIFELRKCSLLVDDELTEVEKKTFEVFTASNKNLNAEISIQENVKKLIRELSAKELTVNRLRAKIERHALKKFGKTQQA